VINKECSIISLNNVCEATVIVRVMYTILSMLPCTTLRVHTDDGLWYQQISETIRQWTRTVLYIMTDACYVWNKVHTINTWSTWFGTHLVENNKIYGQKICQTPKNLNTHGQLFKQCVCV